MTSSFELPKNKNMRKVGTRSIILNLDFPKKLNPTPAHDVDAEISHEKIFMRTGLSRSLLLKMAGQGLFPRPVRQNSFADFWRLSDVDRWCATRSVLVLSK